MTTEQEIKNEPPKLTIHQLKIVFNILSSLETFDVIKQQLQEVGEIEESIKKDIFIDYLMYMTEPNELDVYEKFVGFINTILLQKY